MRTLHYLLLLLTVIGALNWGLVGLFDFNLVKAMLGAYPALERLIYMVIGASALGLLYTESNHCRIPYTERRTEYRPGPDRTERTTVTSDRTVDRTV